MNKIDVSSVVGSACIDSVDGEQIRQKLLPALEKGEVVALDFAGVQTLTSGFLNAAVGRLFGQFTAEQVDARLHVEGLDEDDRELLALVKRNAIRFYSVDPEQRQTLLQTEASLLENIGG